MAHKDILPGFYAIEHADGVTRFFKIEQGTGKWAGKTFLKIQAGDDLHPVRDHAKRMFVLNAVEADPMAATKRYGRAIGRCGICSRTLTDEDSRAAGIGPICAQKM